MPAQRLTLVALGAGLAVAAGRPDAPRLLALLHVYALFSSHSCFFLYAPQERGQRGQATQTHSYEQVLQGQPWVAVLQTLPRQSAPLPLLHATISFVPVEQQHEGRVRPY